MSERQPIELKVPKGRVEEMEEEYRRMNTIELSPDFVEGITKLRDMGASLQQDYDKLISTVSHLRRCLDGNDKAINDLSSTVQEMKSYLYWGGEEHDPATPSTTSLLVSVLLWAGVILLGIPALYFAWMFWTGVVL